MNEKQNGLVKKPLGQIATQSGLGTLYESSFYVRRGCSSALPQGYGVGLKVEQGTYVFHHHRLEPLMRIPRLLCDSIMPFPQRGIK
jgi:hypothetical protein